MPLRITVLGTGYLGATHAACLAELGFEVLGLDTNEAQVSALAAGRLPFHEPELGDMLRNGLGSGRLRFTSSYADAAAFGDVHFVCVGTPQRPDSDAADLTHLMSCVDALAPLLDRPCLVVGKSTVPVGTSEIIAERLAQLAPVGAAAEVAWNPEFLREGHAVADTLRPDRIVVGVRSERAALAASIRATWHATVRPGATSPRRGVTLRHSSMAYGQRGSKRQPGDGSMTRGGSAESVVPASSPAGRLGSGTAESSSFV
jgi:nucleotide sugar dehydrogenase